eukprot:3097516-Alexandrium_andersonii.AAC.1
MPSSLIAILEFIHLRWEDGRAACAPALDGFSWGMLSPKLGSRSGRPESSGADPTSRSNSI